MDFLRSIAIAASGLPAQAGRMRIISENSANADSTAVAAGSDLYRRKMTTFKSEMDRSSTRVRPGAADARPGTADWRDARPAREADDRIAADRGLGRRPADGAWLCHGSGPGARPAGQQVLPARCTPLSRSIRKSRPSTTRRWLRSSATS